MTAPTGAVPSPAPPARAAMQAAPAPGLLTFALHLGLIAAATSMVMRVESGQRVEVLLPISLLGLTLGYVLALSRLPDLLAHLVAMATGVVLSLAFGIGHESGWSQVLANRAEQARSTGRELVQIITDPVGPRVSDLHMLVLVALTMFLVAYGSAWLIYRRYWFMPAMLLPGMVVFAGIRFEESVPLLPLLIFIVLAMVMMSRHHLFLRELTWQRAGMPTPRNLPMRFMASSIAVVLIALLAASQFMPTVPEQLPEQVKQQASQLWDQATEQWDEWTSPNSNKYDAKSPYASFNNGFKIGQELNLSDEKVANLDSDAPHYLVARSYDQYTGTGWASTEEASDTANPESDSPPRLTFDPGQAVPLTGDVASNRDTVFGTITLYAPSGGMLFTIESFSSSDSETQALVGWRILPETPYAVKRIDIGAAPVDLQALLSLLKTASRSAIPGAPGEEPILTDSTLRRQIDQARRHLAQYPLATRLEWDRQDGLILIVSGRLPVYEDVIAVYSADAEAVGSYRVTGTIAVAGPRDLRVAGDDYPAWVTDRYLQQSVTTDQEVADLALRIIAENGATNPYDAAWAIQEYLRSDLFTYELNPEQPPSDTDIVSYFVLESRTGRCEHYASAMVVMLRTIGVPARIVAGYRPSQEIDDLGYVYRDEQAHTWVEVYFPGYGWVPFEPTQGQQRIDHGNQNGNTAVPPTPTPTPVPTAMPTPSSGSPVINGTEPTPTATPASGASGVGASIDSGGVALLTLLLVLLVAMVAAGAWWWGLRGLTPAASLYARTLRAANWLGVRADERMTPAEFARSVDQAVPAAGPAARTVAALYERERYGGRALGPEQVSVGQSAWRNVRGLLWRPFRRRRRQRDTSPR